MTDAHRPPHLDNDSPAVDTSQAEETAAAEPSRHRPSTRVVGIASIVAALVIAAGTGGWWLRGQVDEDEPTPNVTEVGVAVVRNVEIVQGNADPGLSVAPSVVGLTTEQARVVLVDAGLADDAITFQTVAVAGDPDLIIDQDPRPAEPLIGSVVLYVSAQVDMPDLVGLDGTEGREALAQYGARGAITTRYVDGAEPDIIIETAPAAGEPLGYDAQLVVAEAPSAMFLTELQSSESDGGCRRSEVQINGTIYPDSITCTPDRDDLDYLEYTLNRQVSRLRATIGVSDRADDTSTVTFRVIAGDDVSEWTLAYGESANIDIDVTDVLRVRLEATRATETDGRGGVTIGWGTPQLIGSLEAIDAMRNQPSQ